MTRRAILMAGVAALLQAHRKTMFSLISFSSSTEPENPGNLDFPAGIQAGDILFLGQKITWNPGQTVTFFNPTGFDGDQIAFNSVGKFTVHWKLADGTETGPVPNL